MRRHRIWVCVAVGAALCVGAWWSTSEGQTVKTPAPETLLPADAVFYYTSDGLDPHQDSWKKTAAYEALQESGLLAVVDRIVTWALEQGQPESAGFARAAFETLSRKGFSLAIGFPADQKGPAIPQIVVVIHQGANLKPAAAQMIREAAEGELEFTDKTVSGRTVTSAALPAGAEVGWWTEGQHLVIAGGMNAIASTLTVAGGKSPNITKHPLWKAVRNAEGRDITSVTWIDMHALSTRFSGLQFPAGGDVVLTVGSVIQSLGLDGLKTIVARSGFEGRALWSETKVETSGARKGLLAMLDQKPISLADLPPLPVDTSSFSMASFDLGKSYDDVIGVMKSVARLGPDGAAEELDGLISQLPQALGLDLKKDLLDPLGNAVCVYDDPLHGTFGFGVAAAIQVDDPATLRKTLDGLLGRLEDVSRGAVGATRTKKLGRELVSLQFMAGPGGPPMPFGISYVVDQKWLVLGMMPQAVEAFLLRLDGKLPKLQSTPGFAEMVKPVPKSFSGLTVSDPRKTYGFLLSWAPWIASVAQAAMGQRFGGQEEPRANPFPLSAADLPPAELFVRPLFPNVAVTQVDATGSLTTSRSSLPAVPFLSLGGDSAAVAAVAVALLLPAVQQAREAARRSVSKNNMHQLGLAMHNYHETHASLPAGSHPNDNLKIEKRLSWIFDILPFIEQAALYQKFQQDEAWDSETNQPLAKVAIAVLMNPGVTGKPGDYPHAHYVGMAGVGKDSLTDKEHNDKTGVFGENRKTRFADIRDGASNTIMFTEASKDFVPWAQAKGSIRALIKQPYINGPDGIGGPFRGGCHMGLCDGAVRFVSEKIDSGVLEALSTIQGGEVVGEF